MTYEMASHRDILLPKPLVGGSIPSRATTLILNKLGIWFDPVEDLETRENLTKPHRSGGGT
jgi:hypothetical protein